MAPRPNPIPKNATPTKLQLKPPTIPRLPFSSPMGEEVLSPTSPNSRTPPQDPRRGFGSAMTQEGGSKKQTGLADDAPIKMGARERRREESSRRPGLNVVTDFPPRTSSADKGVGEHKKKGSAERNGSVGNTTVQDPPSASQVRHQRQASSKSLKSAGSKSRLDILRRADSKASYLSPSDRELLIGISLPEDEVAEHAKSAISPVQEREQNLGSQLTRDRRPSITPSIIITPAKDIAPWSAEEYDEKPSPPRPRARSSVYSQGPSQYNVIHSSIVPPVPALPPEAKHNNQAVKTRREPTLKHMSTCTIFDEEADPTMGTRPDSAHSQIRILKRSSTDTLANRPRSQGWWNSIMSPFWPKSPMHFKAPPLPSPKNATPSGHDRNTLIEDEDASPIDEKAKSAHTSWTDSPIGEEYERPALTFDQILPSHNRSRSITALQPEPALHDSEVIAGRFEGFGAAAEYFEACWHDMHDPTPFFECQNHQCLPREYEMNGIHKEAMGEPSSRGLGLMAPDASEVDDEAETRRIGAAPVSTTRFSAAVHKANSPKPTQRPMSDATVIEDLDEPPHVQEARASPMLRAPEPIPMAQPAMIREEIEPEERMVQPQQAYRSPPPLPVEAFEQPRKASETPPPPPLPPADSAPPEPPRKRYVAVMPPEPPPHDYEEPKSPPPPTPGAPTQAAGGPLPLRDLRAEADASRPGQDTYIINHNYYGSPPKSGEQTSMADFFPPPRFKPYPKEAEGEDGDQKEREQRKTKERKEKEKLKKEQLTIKDSKRSLRSKLGSYCCCRNKNAGKKDEKLSAKKKRLLWLLTAGLLGMIILILLLVMLLHRKGDSMPVQTQWLNITGYPPIPTGVSTIAQPNAVHEDSGCVNVPDMWSCALPKEQQQSFSSGAADQPNFRIEIRFENGTNATSSLNSSTTNKRSDNVVNAVSAASFIRRRLLQLRSSLPNSLYTPSPPPPTQEDQTFLGNSTDGNHAPFDGEYTPFFMTFDSPASLASASRLAKRVTTSSSPATTPTSAINTTDPFPNLASAIPAASTNPNGTASPANLYPFPSAQPLRLFNRGLPTEYYGFYTYFDRSIFLKSTGAFNGSVTSIPDDANGGASEDSAKVRCTWTQTRFLVQIWTNKGSPYPLLPGNGTMDFASTGQNATSLANSTANDLQKPGSFPYPVTITLDRHGGDVKTKEIYCYGLDDSEKPEDSEKKIQLEDRGFGGTPVNQASGPFATNKVSLGDGGPGGIDGGSGGCRCAWQNWK